MEIYINPNLNLYKSFVDLNHDRAMHGYRWAFDEEKIKVKDLLTHSRLFVLAEPGYGKTELLGKIKEAGESKNLNAIIIDLKTLDINFSIAENIEKMLNRPEVIKTNNFKFSNSENVIICLDALDEVTTNKLSLTIDKIKELLVVYSSVKIFISCRTLYYTNYKNEFLEYKFKFLGIDCFIHYQIDDYLRRNGISDEQIKLVNKKGLV